MMLFLLYTNTYLNLEQDIYLEDVRTIFFIYYIKTTDVFFHQRSYHSIH
jgi:hypothetical protein